MEVAEKAIRVLSSAKYVDARVLKQRSVQFSLRGDSAEHSEFRVERVICRCIANGYGVASAELTEDLRGEELGERALRQAMAAEGEYHLAEVNVEQGEREWRVKEEVSVEAAEEIMLGLRGEVYDHLKGKPFRLEVIVTHTLTEDVFINSEGANVREVTPLTDLVAYLVVRDFGEGFSSLCIGGMGGVEAVKDWEVGVEDMVAKAVDGARAKRTSPVAKWRRQTIILDCDASGVIAHEVAHMLEGDIYRGERVKGAKLIDEFRIFDDPLVNGGYGSFQWDDEGVRGRKKLLLARGHVGLLHTRLSAVSGDEAGNAHGVYHKPRPMMSNVYIAPSDWRIEEILEETKEGFYLRGVVRGEIVSFEGVFHLMPEVAYVIKGGEVVKPIKNLRVRDSMFNVLSGVDAVGRDFKLRPNIDKGFSISEGGPHIRVRKCRIE
ncbi:MAG: TldD/PmbA family protein [Candidatus Freyarchaeota archaeon]|nr:TldD/PmbA family protein [Candidatus Freyrarchaeum guaymaensis]